MRKKSKKTFFLLVILILLNSLIPEQLEVTHAQTTSTFGKNDERVININRVRFSTNGKVNLDNPQEIIISSWSDLEGFLITKDGQRIVRLVDDNHNGNVLINEGINPFVITVKDSIEDALANDGSEGSQNTFLKTSTTEICTDADYINFIVDELGFQRSVLVDGKKYSLNIPLIRDYKFVIYGKPTNIPNNSMKNGEYEFIGFNEYGGWLMNHKYPPVMGSIPPIDEFLKIGQFIGSAESAYALPDVYVGTGRHEQAKETLSYFSYWGVKLTTRKPASWWLESRTGARIKMQGILGKDTAGLGVTQYKSAATGKYWYQTYMIKPKDEITCKRIKTKTVKPDIKATNVTASRTDNNISVKFNVTNNHPKKETILADQKYIKWNLTWEFEGANASGEPRSKSGTFDGSKTKDFGQIYKYGSTYNRSFSFDPKLYKTWSGVITITAEYNYTKKELEESDYTNNVAKTTLSWTRKGVPTTTCPNPNVRVEPRYEYELDFAVTNIEGQTVDKGTQTTTPVKVKRLDFSGPRTQAKNAIKKDIADKKVLLAQQEKELANLEKEKASLEKDMADEMNEEEPDGAKIASLTTAIQNKEKEIAKKKCDIEETKLWISEYEEELSDLESAERKYESTSPKLTLTFDEDEVETKVVTLRERDEKEIIFKWILQDSGYVGAEINPDDIYPEINYKNNYLETPVYISSYDMGACTYNGESSFVEAVVRTITTENGTQELNESLTGTLVNQSRNQLRAGFGFSYDLLTVYKNEDPKSNGSGPTLGYSYFPTLVSHLPYSYIGDGYRVPMDTTGINNVALPKQESKTWSLPVVYVEEFSGNVFDSNYSSNPNRNPYDRIINGGRKWYIPFDLTDGPYDFSSNAYNAGINHLSVCVRGNVNVSGTIIGEENGNDDFVKRTITPDNPFPSGTGWNWSGQMSNITSLKDWYNNWYEDPNQIPRNSYNKTFYLRPETLEQIRTYNEGVNHQYRLGSSIFNSMSIRSIE